MNLCAVSLPSESEPLAVIPVTHLPELLEALASEHPGVAFDVWEAGHAKPAVDHSTMGHGTPQRYNHLGCRCTICSEAHRESNRRNYESRKQRLAADPSAAVHGRRSTYDQWGCRCAPCRKAASDGWRTR